MEAQAHINGLIETASIQFPIPERVNFANSKSSDFNEDIQSIFSCLDNVAQRLKPEAAKLKENIAKYLEASFLPKLKRLEILIILSAFVVRNKPFVDLFYVSTQTGRRLKTGKEFVKLFCGSFMSLYYKVCYMTALVFLIMFIFQRYSWCFWF